MRFLRSRALLLAAASLTAPLGAACGTAPAAGSARAADTTDDSAGSQDSSGSQDVGGQGADAGPATPSPSGNDNGSPSQTFPAFSPAIGQLVNQGGFVLSAPKFVTVTWTADPNESTLEALDDQIGSTAFWQAATSEYGVGPATGGGHVEITDPPFHTLADTTIASYISSHVSNAPANGWPASDPQTVYVVYIPESTSFTTGGVSACSSLEGYHDELINGDGSHTLFAIIAEGCHDDTVDALDAALITATHELAEASTDPHVESDTAWDGFDAPHLAWSIFNLRDEEDGDACQFYPEASVTTAQANGAFPFGFQRLWSNAAGAAGSNPCVFASDGAGQYYNVTPLNTTSISVIMPPKRTAAVSTLGYHISVGQTATFQVGFYSDGPVGAWNLSAVEDSPFRSRPKTGDLSFAIDMTSGVNGQIANVTVTVNSQPNKTSTGILMTLVSTSPNGLATHYMPVLIETD